MDLTLKKPVNKDVAKKDIEFMKDSNHNEAAAEQLNYEIQRRGLKTKGELIDYAKGHGYLKTEMDKKVVKHVLLKSQLPDKPDYDKERREMEKRNKEFLNKTIRESRNITKVDVRELAEIAKKKLRYERI